MGWPCIRAIITIHGLNGDPQRIDHISRITLCLWALLVGCTVSDCLTYIQCLSCVLTALPLWHRLSFFHLILGATLADHDDQGEQEQKPDSRRIRCCHFSHAQTCSTRKSSDSAARLPVSGQGGIGTRFLIARNLVWNWAEQGMSRFLILGIENRFFFTIFCHVIMRPNQLSTVKNWFPINSHSQIFGNRPSAKLNRARASARWQTRTFCCPMFNRPCQQRLSLLLPLCLAIDLHIYLKIEKNCLPGLATITAILIENGSGTNDGGRGRL